MLKSIIINLAKRYAVNAVQEAIACRKSDVAKWSSTVGVWVARVRLVVAFLERLSARLSDGELSNDEVETTTKELGDLADEVTR